MGWGSSVVSLDSVVSAERVLVEEEDVSGTCGPVVCGVLGRNVVVALLIAFDWY